MSNYPAVLYVEDDPFSRSVMEIILRDQLGLTSVEIFEDSTDFVARLEALPFEPDLIFLDIQMLPIDGFAMLEILRDMERFAARPIVALTASVMNEEVARLRTAGFNGVIPKPIDIDAFPDLMAQLLDGQEVWRITK